MSKKFIFGGSLKETEIWASFTTASTTSANWLITTKNGGQYRVAWGDGTITTHDSDTTATKTYSTPYSGVVKIGTVDGGTSNISILRSSVGAWNFNISIIKDQLPTLDKTVFFSGNSMTLTGDISTLPSSLTINVTFSGNSMTLTGDISTLPSSLTSNVYFEGNSMTLTGNIATLPSSLTNRVHFVGNSMTLTGNIATLPSGLTSTVYFTGNSMTLTGDISTLPSGLTSEVYFNGNSMTLTGNIVTLPSGLTSTVLFSGSSMTLTGNISTLPSGLTTTVYFAGSAIALTGDISTLPSGLTSIVHFVGNSMTLTGDISTLPSSLANRVTLTSVSMALTGDIKVSLPNVTMLVIQSISLSTNINYTSGRVWKNMTQLIIRLKVGRLTATEVDNIFIDLDNSPLVTGAGTIDLRGNNAPPTAASLVARNSLVTKGKAILTN